MEDNLKENANKLNDLAQSSNEIKKSQRKYPWNRFKNRIKRALQTGSFQLVVSILLFTIAIAYMVKFVNDKRYNDEKIKQQNQLFIEQSQEKRRNNPNYGILSAILAPYNKEEGEKTLTQEGKSIFTLLRNSSNSSIDYLVSDIDSVKLENLKIKTKLEYKDSSQQIADSHNGNPPLLFEYKNESSPREPTTVLIPPTEFSTQCQIDEIKTILDTISKTNTPYNALQQINSNQPCILEDTWKSLLTSLVISQINLDTIERIIGNLEQVYFVSFDGIFSHRVYNPELEQLKRVAEEQPMYRWEASSYAQFFINPKNRNSNFYESKAYLDIAGLGIVKTLSLPIFDQEKNLIGVICFDKQIKISNYLKIISKEDSIISNPELVKYQERKEDIENIKWRYGAYDFSLFKLPIGEKIGQTNLINRVYELPSIESSIRNNIISYIRNRDTVSEYDQVNRVGRTNYFRVILRRDENYHHVLYIAASKQTAFNEFGFPAILVLSLILASFTSFFYAARVAIANNEKAGLTNIIRNLPIGVLELEKNQDSDLIKYGNDYAEEITGFVFDRFGERNRYQDIKYSEVFDLASIIEKKQTEDLDFELLPTTYETIENIRNNQRKTTSYFVKLNLTNRPTKEELTDNKKIWIEITGSPIINIESDSNQTFGVFKKVSDKNLIKKLNEIDDKRIK
jgi:hypothetical protein